jgi:stage IV sporulation protein FB
MNAFQKIISTKWKFTVGMPMIFYVSLVSLSGWSAAAMLAMVFISVIFHEMFHAMAAISLGHNVHEIELLPIGGLAKLEPRNGTDFSIRDDLIITAAGPLSSLLLAGFSAVFWPGEPMMFQINLGLAIFNCLPLWPMDGGRILNCLLRKFYPAKARAWTFGIGLVAGGVMMVALALNRNLMGVIVVGIMVAVNYLNFGRSNSSEKKHKDATKVKISDYA